MYGKVMSLPDAVLTSYFDFLTDVPGAEIAEMAQALESDSVHPMELKKRLARDITGQFYGPHDASQAEDHFERVVQNREAPDDVAEYAVDLTQGGSQDITVVLVGSGVVGSRNEARRLVQQGAVEVDGERVASHQVELSEGALIKSGRRRYIRIVRA